MSRDDRGGNDPLRPNDQLRLLVGYEWEARPNFTVGLQYYLEWTQDHDALLANSFAPQFEPDEYRHLLTNRMSYRAGRDKHIWSLFTFFSPSDSDLYLRPVYTYRRDDNWSVTAGANLFGGNDNHTFFGQLQDASNAYIRIRMSKVWPLICVLLICSCKKEPDDAKELPDGAEPYTEEDIQFVFFHFRLTLL